MADQNPTQVMKLKSSQLCGRPNKLNIWLLTPSKEIQYRNLIDEIEKQLKGKKQNGRHAKTVNNTLYVYIPAPVPVPVYTCTCTCVQVYTYIHPCLTNETLASNLKGKTQNGRHDKTLNNTLCTYSAHITCIPNHVSGASSTQETTYVTVSRDDVRDHLERQRTWSPRETTYVITSRENKHDRLERRRTWLPQETSYMIASWDDVRVCLESVLECEPVLWRDMTYHKPEEPREV